MGWFVYLLECADGTWYCGITTDIERRVREHNGEEPGGAKYTKGRRPVKVITQKACADRSEALRIERKVKKLPKARKRAFLASPQP